MTTTRIVALAAMLACALASAPEVRASDDDCALERARAMLATRLKDWFIVNNSAWLRDPERYAARALDPQRLGPELSRQGVVVEVSAPSHGSCVKWLLEIDPPQDPTFTVLEERSCSKAPAGAQVVRIVLEEVDMRPNDVPMAD